MSLPLAFALLLAAQAGLADPFAGRWQLLPEQSRFPGAPPVREDFIFEIETDGRVRFIVEEETGRGELTAVWEGRFDGKDYPMTGAPGRDTLAMVRVTDRVIMGVYKDKSRVSYAFTRAISDDGRIMTSRVLGSTADGRPVDVKLVHEKP